MCHSLADAHARGLVHRDITPANIYACRMGLEYDFVKVLDFGLVKFNDRSAMQTTLMTGAHTTTGTPAFMAPEIILNEGEVDQRADVYALGCVAYYLLTGQLVFEADTPMKMFLQHMQTRRFRRRSAPSCAFRARSTSSCSRVSRRIRRSRPQSAEQLLRMVRNCRSGETWDYDTARGWWQTHLPDLTGALTVADTPLAGAAARWPRLTRRPEAARRRASALRRPRRSSRDSSERRRRTALHVLREALVADEVASASDFDKVLRAANKWNHVERGID